MLKFVLGIGFKKLSIWLALLLAALIPIILATEVLFAGTSVSGTISSNTTWSAANSPYLLTGHLQIASGGSLTIDPGVEVDLNGYFIHVVGTLRLEGTEASKVSVSGSAATSDDNYIHFKSSSVPYDTDTNTGSLIDHANINTDPVKPYENNQQPPIKLESAAKISNSTITSTKTGLTVTVSGAIITNNIIKSGAEYGVRDRGSIFTNNVIYGENDVTFDCQSSDVVFRYNRLIGSGNGAGFSDNSCSNASLEYNVISGYTTGIEGRPSASGMSIQHNSLFNNTQNWDQP